VNAANQGPAGSTEVAAGALSEVTVTVNGATHTARVEARRTLSDYLRHDVGLTGTHVGCEHGVCGACTVLLDGQPVRSCLVFAVSAAGHRVTTAEGLGQLNEAGDPESLSPVQRAFRDCHALQCGFCTPGFMTTITAGLVENPAPSRDEAVEMIAGNLCRCTGYQNIVDAVLRAAELTASEDRSHGATQERSGEDRSERGSEKSGTELQKDPKAPLVDRFAEHAADRPADDPPAGPRGSADGESEPSDADGIEA
jgi:carbon-monoxide dehydrogenase small subunit